MAPSNFPPPTPEATPGASATPGAPKTPAAPKGPEIKHTLVPLEGKEKTAPKITSKTTLTMTTTAGVVVIEVYPDAAPNAAERFVELAESGFYDDTPVSRVVNKFVAQFGINWRAKHREWKEKKFKDDPSFYRLERGTLAFAKGGADTNSTQVFINFQDNSGLAAPEHNFTTFGKVVSGMEAVDSFARVGHPSHGLDQVRLWSDGGNYLDSLNEKPTMIETVVVEK